MVVERSNARMSVAGQSDGLRVFFARPFYFVNIDVLEESFALVEREIFETSKTLRR